MSAERTERDVIPYEPPKVTALGNVRDLLAGAEGTVTDADPSDPDFPNQASS
jgi:hypothetical protein